MNDIAMGTGIWGNITAVFRMFSLSDLLDILIVAFLIYHLIMLVRETRARQLLKGVIGILLLYLVADQIGLRTLKALIEYVIRYGVIVLLVLFQPELRRILEQVGRANLSSFQLFGPAAGADEQKKAQMLKTISAVCDSCALLSKEHIGALIVMEKLTRIGDIIATGTVIDAQTSSDLIKNIFFPNSPLHDGALVIRDGRLYAAGCFLPLSDNFDISRNLGTRHRAALGMSEVCDAVIIVVSEETGAVSVAQNGKLTVGVTLNMLNSLLHTEFIDEKEPQTEKKKLFRRGKK